MKIVDIQTLPVGAGGQAHLDIAAAGWEQRLYGRERLVEGER